MKFLPNRIGAAFITAPSILISIYSIILQQQQKIQGDFSLELSSALKDSLHSMGMELLKNNSEAQSKMQDTMIQTLKEIQNANDKRLYDIQNNVNAKLLKSIKLQPTIIQWQS